MASELRISTPLGTLACKLWGQDAPTTDRFIAVHGAFDNAGSFDPLMKHFVTNGMLVSLAIASRRSTKYHHTISTP